MKAPLDAIYISRAQVERWSEEELKANIDYPPAQKELDSRNKIKEEQKKNQLFLCEVIAYTNEKGKIQWQDCEKNIWPITVPQSKEGDIIKVYRERIAKDNEDKNE